MNLSTAGFGVAAVSGRAQHAGSAGPNAPLFEKARCSSGDACVARAQGARAPRGKGPKGQRPPPAAPNIRPRLQTAQTTSRSFPARPPRALRAVGTGAPRGRALFRLHCPPHSRVKTREMRPRCAARA